MRGLKVARRIAVLVIPPLILSLWLSRGQAADPQPYDVVLKPTGTKPLDAAVHDSAELLTLKDKAPVGGFALVQRAQGDSGRFEEALRAFGYYDGTVAVTIDSVPLDDPGLVDRIDRAPAKPPVKVAVTLDPGPQYRIGTISFDHPLPASIVSAVGLKHGDPALAAEVLAARDKLLTAIREASYPLATVTLPPSVLHRDQHELDVPFVVETGPKANLGPIAFTGLRDMNAAFVRKRLLLHSGQPFSPSKIEEARQDLLSIGTFSSVRIDPAEKLDAAGELPLTIAFEERPLHAVDLGAAWSTDLGASLSAAWHQRNLFGNAEQLNITASVQLGGDATTSPGAQLGAQFIKPDFLARDQQLEISLNSIKQSLVAYDQTALIERIGLNRKLSPHWSVQFGLLAEQEEITQEEVSRPYNFVGVPLSVKYDDTKSLLDPTSGLRVTVSVTPYQSLGGGGGTYTVSQVSGSTYFDLFDNGRTVLALRGLVGEVSGVGVFGLPPDQRLYAGGTSTVRGYRYQSIGPQFADNKPIGGTAVSAGSVEYRQRFLESFGAAVFVDAGQASDTGSPFSSTWRIGAGAGLRYYTPIGPIRVDFAVPLSRQHGDDSFEVYIGIGQAF